MSEFISQSTEETIALGERLGALLREGDVLVLTGDLGAGKTQLTKGIATALGVSEEITSPTFNIHFLYEGTDAAGNPVTLHHFDLYRLEDAEELGDAGLYDALGVDGICVLEWGEQFERELGDERLDVVLMRAETGDLAAVAATDEPAGFAEPERRISFIPHGERARAIVEGLAL